MPRVIKRTPEWLVPPSPGHHVFTAKPSKGGDAGKIPNSPLRNIARGRGSEVFVASGSELRWADLGTLKQEFQETETAKTAHRSRDTGEAEAAFRVLKVPGAGAITQLHVSRDYEYLAIVRSHQIYIAVLPDSRHLQETDLGPYKLKCFHLGPTIHCIEESPVVSALWHPLGELGRCLVTVTGDAVVRLWEISRDDRSSFDQPTTAIDLKKLANAVSADQDFSASKFGSGKGFTPDFVELEPASVCFGGTGVEGENPWHAMTMWLATKGGDIYSLCPLLPRKFETSADFIEQLRGLVAAKRLEADEDRSKALSADAQRDFLNALQDQEPMLAQGTSEFEARYVYSKPMRPGPAPKLQGPFDMDPELSEDSEFADIYVAPFEIGAEHGFDEEPELPGSSSLVCLLTNRLEVLMTIDFSGVDGQWVPARGTPFSTPKNRSMVASDEYHTLTFFECIQLPFKKDVVLSGPPGITPDVISPHAFFVTDVTGVHYISAASWIRNIQTELTEANSGNNTSTIRLDATLDSAQSLVEQPITFPTLMATSQDPTPASCIVFPPSSSSGLSYFVLTTRSGEPFAATLDISDSELSSFYDSAIPLDDFESYSTYSVNPDSHYIILNEPRDVYRPDPIFEQPSRLPQFLVQATSDRKAAALLREEVDMESMPTLELMIQTHRKVQEEYDGLNRAAAALFAQSEKLRSNLLEQIKRARELRDKVDAVTGNNDEEASNAGLGNERLQERIELAKEKKAEIDGRVEKLKKNLAKISTREMSDKEKAWARELESLDRKIVTGEIEGEGEEDGVATSSGLMDRVMKVTRLKDELVKVAKEMIAEGEEGVGGSSKMGTEKENGKFSTVASPRKGAVPSGFRKARIEGINELLVRETVLVERAAEKFARLKVV